MDAHFIQQKVLVKLFNSEKLKLKSLKIDGITSDLLLYHINKLIDFEFVEKQAEYYLITKKGVENNILLATDLEKDEIQPLQAVLAFCFRNNRSEVLVQKRNKHPDLGYISFPGGKIRKGYTFEENMLRELTEETGLTGTPKLKLISHILKEDKDGEIYRDLVIYRYIVDNPTGELINTREGDNFFVKVKDFKKLPKIYNKSYETLLKMQNSNDDLSFEDKKVKEYRDKK